jgi:hypothetical protein
LLTDSRKAGPLIPDDIAFFRTKVVPRFASLGIRKVAVIEPESIFSKLVIRDMMEGARTVELLLFGCEEEALEWLQKTPEPVL